MAEFTHLELRDARDAKKIPRWKLASEVNVSEETIERWESGKCAPGPEDVDRIGEALNDPTLWHRWMLSHYDSYRRRYISTQNLALPVAIANLGLKVDDLTGLQRAALSDAIDGKIDDPSLRNSYRARLQEIIAAASTAMQQIT